MAGYTVIDVETTGLNPRRDRVVEIGVVKVSHEGEVHEAWGTLINPGRDVGASSIHGISARDVVKAPTFEEVAPTLLDAVDGRIVAAHNARFDTRFLTSELLRAGYPVDEVPVPAVCTMAWSGSYLDSPSRRLCDCCASAGIELHDAHSALGDAVATAHLLASYLTRAHYRPAWQDTLEAARAFSWPSSRPVVHEPAFLQRSDITRVRPDGWLDRIVARLPHTADPCVEAYLASLEMAMLDGRLSLHEEDHLIEVAAASSLTRDRVLAIHADYLVAMARVALADGVVTDEERLELDRAAACLGLSVLDVDQALSAASSDSGDHDLRITGMRLEPGDRVTFTGEMAVERTVWEERARAVGLEPAGLAKKTKVLVAADPDSLSGKAAKARSYGIPIIDETCFEKLLRPLEA